MHCRLSVHAVVLVLTALVVLVVSGAGVWHPWDTDVSRAHRVALGMLMYTQDYQGVFPKSNKLGLQRYWGILYDEEHSDQAWPQVAQPYMGDWVAFRAVEDLYSWEYHLTMLPKGCSHLSGSYPQWVLETCWAFHSHVGYNYNWLAPLVGNCEHAEFRPVSIHSIPQWRTKILFVSSAYWRDKFGHPACAGRWIIDAPAGPADLSCSWGGWRCWPQDGVYDLERPSCVQADAFGFAYHWFGPHRLFVVTHLDGHVSLQRVERLAAGSDPATHTVTDWNRFQWGWMTSVAPGEETTPRGGGR
jgi:hypothetical protein